MRRIVLTGATGFVGTQTIPALQARGFEVHAVGRRPPSAGIIFHPANLLDAEELRRIIGAVQASHLLHLAWYAEPGLYWNSPINLDWVAATLNLVRAFRDAGGQRAIVAGTCAEYAWRSESLIEDALCAPATIYGAAKDATRRVLAPYATETGLSYAWARLFYVYGAREKPGRLVSDAIRALSSGSRFATSMGYQRRDFSHVTDVASALAALVDSSVAGPINVASGTAVPVREMLMQIARLVGRADLIDFGGRPLAENEPASIVADVKRLHLEVGFRPRFDIERGLAHTVATSFRKDDADSSRTIE